MTPYIWSKRASKSFGMICVLIFLSESQAAEPVSGPERPDGISYFQEPEMDFWKKPGLPSKEGARTTAKVTPKVKPGVRSSSGPVLNASGSNPPSEFPWAKYLDPKNEEFFREGEYLPPAPFMEIARNPSDDNIALWFQYVEEKNKLLRRLQEKLTDYAKQHQENPNALARLKEQIKLPPELARQISNTDVNQALLNAAAKIDTGVTLNQDAKRFRLRLYFDSKCPHCVHMMETVKALMNRGFFVELRQIDSDIKARNKIPFPVVSATPADLKQYKIQSVPVLLVGDLKAKTFFKVEGYQTEQAVLSALSQSIQTSQVSQGENL